MSVGARVAVRSGMLRVEDGFSGSSAKRPNSDYEGSIAGRILHVPKAISVIRNLLPGFRGLMQLSSPLGKLPGIR